MEKVKNISLIIAIVVVLALISTVCFGIYKNVTMEVKNPIATMEVEGYGTVKIELYPDQAPETVANFIKLANNGFYNGLTFHRTIPDFMIQGGDKNGDGTGSPTLKNLLGDSAEDKEYAIKGEFLANQVKNTIKHKKGTISMARSDYSSLGLNEQGYNSAGSQFFIVTTDMTSSLDGSYAAFGQVTEGYDIVEKIANVDVVTRDENAEEGLNKPVNPPVIKSLSVETFGVDYGTPETLDVFDYQSYLQQLYGINNGNATINTENTDNTDSTEIDAENTNVQE
jgi:peptidyl-prolyl cis-trans isomerase B (cyclophilin B)